MATIFTVTDSRTAGTLAFSSADAMLAYVRDLHADLAPEGSALMLDGVPATNRAVKAHFAGSKFRGVFTVAGDGADAVTALQSKLDGAIQACAALGIDADNVAKVGELREALALAIASVDTDDSLTIDVRELVLHKRRKASRKS